MRVNRVANPPNGDTPTYSGVDTARHALPLAALAVRGADDVLNAEPMQDYGVALRRS